MNDVTIDANVEAVESTSSIESVADDEAVNEAQDDSITEASREQEDVNSDT